MFLYWIPFMSLANQDYCIDYLQWSIDNMFLVELDQELMPNVDLGHRTWKHHVPINKSLDFSIFDKYEWKTKLFACLEIFIYLVAWGPSCGP